jgi:hypothetical protein
MHFRTTVFAYAFCVYFKVAKVAQNVHYVIVTRSCGKPQEVNVMGGSHAGRPNMVPGRRASFNRRSE